MHSIWSTLDERFQVYKDGQLARHGFGDDDPLNASPTSNPGDVDQIHVDDAEADGAVLQADFANDARM